MFTFLYIWSDWVMLALRVFLGIVFIVHGLPKLKNLKQTSEWFDSVGFKPGTFWGPFAAILEVFGGTALFLGAFTQIFAALFAVEMAVVTLWKLGKGQKFAGGYEFDMALAFISLILLTSGITSYSVDDYLLQYLNF